MLYTVRGEDVEEQQIKKVTVTKGVQFVSGCLIRDNSSTGQNIHHNRQPIVRGNYNIWSSVK